MIQRVFIVLAQIVLLLATSSGQPATQKPAHPQKPAQPKTDPHASWTPALEKNLGITQQAFHDMGLGMLTQEQEINLFVWVNERERQAKSATAEQTFDCGRQGESFVDAKPESYDRVRVYVDASGDATETISGVRERLRAMTSTEVVYSSNEADLTVSLVAMQTQSKGGQQTGSAISVVVSDPCLWNRGTHTTRIANVQNQFVQVGSDVKAMVDAIVSNIDTNDLDPQRKTNAELKKMLLGQRNK
jgi:hypothetical protein